MIVTVKDKNVDIANRILKKRMQKAGIFQYLQKSKHFISPTQKRTEKKNNKMKTIAKFLRNKTKTDTLNKKSFK